jgi:1-acyl-sn-glycerol-3-phosphate acyltransferase
LKILSYPLSIVYWLLFGFLLVFFHLLQVIALNLGGYTPHKKTVEWLNWGLMAITAIIGGRMIFRNRTNIPEGVPLIFVSNHQSMMDIPYFVWHLRKYHPKFVSKIELGRGIPSVSYNLRHGGSVLIDRKDREQSLKALSEFGEYIEKNRYSVVIFPEGTRSRTGEPKRFAENGLRMLLDKIPSAWVVPISINNSWKLFNNGVFPMPLGLRITMDVHEAIKASEMPLDDLLTIVEKKVKDGIINTQE